MPWLLLVCLVAVGLAGCTAMQSGGSNPSAAPDIRVSTFNIRFGTANDGPNHWDLRHPAVVAAIRAFDPDILGTQETLAMQRDFLLTALPEYAAVAAGRDDGRERGEMTAAFYRRDRFELLASGHFWLSPTPEVPGSMGWDTAITRMATWLRLRDRRAPAGAPAILVINTHFDHVGQVARRESARLIRRRAAEMGEGCSVIVLGDFNAGEDDPPYAALLEPTEGASAVGLRDAYRVVHPGRRPDEGTFQAFDPKQTGGNRIDWILVSPDFEVLAAEIDRSPRGGRLPSDHFPVNVTLRRGG